MVESRSPRRPRRAGGGRLGRAGPVAAGPGPHRHRRPRPRWLPPAGPDGRADGRRPGSGGGRDAPRPARRAGRRGLARPAARTARRPAPTDLGPPADRRAADRPRGHRAFPGRLSGAQGRCAGRAGGIRLLVRGGCGGQPGLPAGEPSGLALRSDHRTLGPPAQLRAAWGLPGRLGEGRAAAARRPSLLPGLGAVPGAGRRAARRGPSRPVRRRPRPTPTCRSGSPTCLLPTPGPPGCPPWCGPRPCRRSDPAARWRLREAGGAYREVVELAGEPWPLFARSLGEPVPVFGEWGPAGFRPLSLLPDADGSSFSAVVAAQAA